jgi:hypothetical protein
MSTPRCSDFIRADYYGRPCVQSVSAVVVRRTLLQRRWYAVVVREAAWNYVRAFADESR